jgi:hypothetical protein
MLAYLNKQAQIEARSAFGFASILPSISCLLLCTVDANYLCLLICIFLSTKGAYYGANYP